MKTKEIILAIQDATALGSPYEEKGLTRYCIQIDDDNAKETISNALKNAGLKKEHLTQLKKDGALFGYYMDDRTLHIRLKKDFLLNMESDTEYKYEFVETTKEADAIIEAYDKEGIPAGYGWDKETKKQKVWSEVQPKQMQGKLIAERSSICITTITGKAGEIVATCNTTFGKDGEGLAQRLVKADNMHEYFKHETGNISHYASTALKSLNNGSLSEVRGMLEGILEKSKQLLKQATQKMNEEEIIKIAEKLNLDLFSILFNEESICNTKI